MLIRFADKDTEPLANERLGFLKSLVFCVTKEILGIRRIFRRDVFFLFLSFLCLISAEFSAAADGTTSSQVQKEHPVEVFLERTKGGNSQFYIPESANLLVGSLGDQNWEVLSYDRPELVGVLRHNAPDFIFTNSDLGAVLQRYLHYKHLLSFKNKVSTDAGKLSGSLIVTAKNSDIQNLDELSGKKSAAWQLPVWLVGKQQSEK